VPTGFVATLAGRDAEVLRSTPFAVLPVGSIEYHGNHAPLGTDITLAEGFAHAVASRRGCLVLPTIAYSFVPPLTRDHGPGLSVPPDVFLAYVTAVMEGARGIGLRRLLVVNGHSENQYALRLAAEQVSERHRDFSVLLVNWWQLVDAGGNGAAARAFGEGGGHGHGGPLEISVTAAFQPDGVVPGAGHADVAYEAPWWRGQAQVVGVGQAPVGFAGYHGEVSRVDASVGRVVVEQVTERLLAVTDGWLERCVRADAPTMRTDGHEG
jgi:creatinine amidohydrolase